MSNYIKLTGVILGCILSSCHSYKPLVNDQKVSPETIKENITVGKKYEILTNSGLKMYVKVDSIGEDRLIGNTQVFINGSSHREKSYIIYFANVESIRYQKFSAGKTLAAIIIPIGIFALLWGSMDPLEFSVL